MKKNKVVELLITSLVCIFIMVTTVYADASVTNHKKIYGKAWIGVYTGKMDSYTNAIKVKVTDINDAKNQQSDYKKVRARVAYKGDTLSICSSEVTLVVKETYTIRLTSYYPRGTTMQIAMKGNNEKYDAYVAFDVYGLSDLE